MDEKDEPISMADVVDQQLLDAIRRINKRGDETGEHGIGDMIKTHHCSVHYPMVDGVVALLRCHRVLLAQERMRSRMAAAYASGVATVLIVLIEVGKYLLVN